MRRFQSHGIERTRRRAGRAMQFRPECDQPAFVRAGARSGGDARQSARIARSLGRHTLSTQRPKRLEGCRHELWQRAVPRLCGEVLLSRRALVRSRRLDHARQDQHPGIRPDLDHRTRRQRADPQSVAYRLFHRRLQRRRRGGRGGRHRAGGPGFRRRRFDPDSGQLLRTVRPQAEPRTDPGGHGALRELERHGGGARGFENRPRQRGFPRPDHAAGRAKPVRAARISRVLPIGARCALPAPAHRHPGHPSHRRGSRRRMRRSRAGRRGAVRIAWPHRRAFQSSPRLRGPQRGHGSDRLRAYLSFARTRPALLQNRS